MEEIVQNGSKLALQADTNRLDSLIQAQPDLAAYARDLSKMLHEIGIGVESFSILRPREDVIAMGATLLGHLEMNDTFLDKPINALLTLGIADAYIRTLRDRSLSDEDRAAKQESLMLSLGLASYELTTKTHSRYMSTNFDSTGNQLKRIKPLRGPSFARRTAAEKAVRPVNVNKVIQGKTDELATRRFEKTGKIAQKPADVYIADVAKRLGIPATKIPPISFTILAAPENKLNIGAGAITKSYLDGRKEVVLPNDWNEHNAEHEIIHALVAGWRFGFRNNVGRGVNEAMTEMLTSTPSTYEPQRKILASLFEKMGPVFEYHMKNSYIHGNQESFTIALGELVRQFGIQAVYQLFYLSSGITQFQVNDSGFIDRAFLSSESVMNFFNPQQSFTHVTLEAEVID